MIEKKKRRKRSDSVAGDQDIYLGATSAPIAPPAHSELPDSVLPFWVSVVSAKTRRAWTDHDLEIAVDLAWCKYKSKKLMLELEHEEDVVPGASGALIVNPKHKVLDTLVKRARMLAAHLQVHPEATQGKSGKQNSQNQKHHAAKNSVAGDSGSLDSLIPRQAPAH